MNTCCGSVAWMQKLISISLNLFRYWYCSLNYIPEFLLFRMLYEMIFSDPNPGAGYQCWLVVLVWMRLPQYAQQGGCCCCCCCCSGPGPQTTEPFVSTTTATALVYRQSHSWICMLNRMRLLILISSAYFWERKATVCGTPLSQRGKRWHRSK